jgi:(p)ppGpp synthase/HD superfamily hydrolase
MDMSEVIRFVQKAHGYQMYGDMPYIVHPLLVERHFTDTKRKIIALLHDVVEDTYVLVSDIRDMFGDEIADAVDAITARDGENYLEEYIPRCAKNYDAACVKLADLEENMYSAENNYPKYASLLARYGKAHDFLSAHLQRMEFGHD